MKYIDAEKLKAWLQKEADIEFKKTEENANSPVLCHFHNGCRMQALDTIDFIDTLSEEPDKSLEEAAEDFVWEVMENDEDGISDLRRKLYPTSKINDFYDALAEFFKAGAKWMEKQMMNEHPPILDKYYKLPQKR